MTARERIIKFVEYKGISKSKFYKETGLSNGFLDKNNHPGVDKIERIIYTYPDINPYWLLTGQGEMISDRYKLKTMDINEFLENAQSNGNQISDFDFFYNLTLSIPGISETSSLCDNFIENISKLNSFLDSYDLFHNMIGTIRSYKNGIANREDIKDRFRYESLKVKELYQIIKPYQNAIEELTEKLRDFNKEDDRCHHLDND